MNLKSIILFLGLVTTSTVGFAQVNSPQSVGYAVRAAQMLSDGNFQGCIDQCKVAVSLGDNNREQLDWLSALASFKGNFPDAGERLSLFCIKYPSNRNVNAAKLMLAILEFRQQEFADALKIFDAIDEKTLNADQQDDLSYHKAFCLIKLGKNNDALSELLKIEQCKRYVDAVVFYKGYIKYCESDYDEALSLFDACNKDCKPGDMADYYIAQIYFTQKKYADAINLAMPLLSRKDIPESFYDETSRIIGECLYELGNVSQAIEYLRPYVDKYPATSPLSTKYIVGMEYYQLGDYDKAIKLLAPVTEVTDEMGQSAALTVGQAYHALGNIKAAILAYNKATRLDFVPKLTEEAYYNYAVAQVDGGRVPFGKSITTLEEFLQRYPSSKYADKVKEYLLTGYMVTDDYEAALQALESLSMSSNDNVQRARQQVNFVLGTRALQAGNGEKSRNYLRESLKYSTYDSEIARQCYLWLGDASYLLGEYEDAIENYRSYLKIAPTGDVNRAVAQYNLAYSHFNLKQYDVARTEFRAAESSRTLSKEITVDCLNRIADTYYYSSDFKTAANTYKLSYERMPSVGDYSLFQYAIMSGNMGDYQKKLALLEDMIQQFPSSGLRPKALMEKAQTLNNLGWHSDAIAVYENVIREYPETSQGRNSLLQLATINSTAGNKDSAIEYYKSLIKIHPTSAEASLAVSDLTRIYGENGKIEELNTFLEGIPDAPQLDAVERNAIAAASLLRTAKTGADDETRLNAALEMLQKYPDANGAEEALIIAADIEYNKGLTDRALEHYSKLESVASGANMRHAARMGILRSARDMGLADRILSVSDNILSSSAGNNADIQEVKFIRAGAFAEKGDELSAVKIWSELATTPTEIFGTRAAFELADYYYQNNKISNAMETAENLINSNPPHAYWLARTYILYSDILRAQGMDFEADEYLKVLRANYPGTENDIFLMIDKRLPKQ